MDDAPSPVYRYRQLSDADSDDETVDFDFDFELPQRRANPEPPSQRNVIDLSEFEKEYDAAIDLTGDDDDDLVFQRAQSASPQSVQGLGRFDGQLHEFICGDGLVIKAGVTVELSEPLTITGLPAPFLKVTKIFDNGDRGAILRGIPFARARHVKKMLARKINEVCMLVLVGNNQIEVPYHEVSARRVVRIRDLRTTNSAYPEHGYNIKDFLRHGKEWVLTHSPLACRWKFVQIFDTSLTRRKNVKPIEWELVRIQENEADEKYRERSEFLVNKWRGGTIPGGSFKASGSEVPVVDLSSTTRGGQQQRGRVPLSRGQQYTAGDTFAGAGGASRGIELAGARLVFAVDHWESAAKTLKANFAEEKTKVHQMDIYDFVTSPEFNCRVDLLHLSPPCQVWSPAHTTAGQNDETNEAALWSCTHIINKVRPRLFTVEQTFGILAPRFRAHFGLFIAGFTDLGYSIRWKVIHLKTFGLPQPRRRVIIFGAGPGEKLPPFPPPTHAENGAGGLKPFTTARHALHQIGRAHNDPLHTPKLLDRPRTPWDPNGPLPNTMTCGGGQNYHWSGTRDFTLREYALLQGFPPFHRFEAPAIKKQIGNAFPPSVVKVFYRHLIAWLDKTDGIDPSSRQREDLATLFGPQATGARAIELPYDDSDGDDEVMCLRAGPRKRNRTGGHHETGRAKRAAHVVIPDDDDDAAFLYSDSSGTSGRGSGSGSTSPGSSPLSGGSSSSPSVTPPQRRPGMGVEVVQLGWEMEQLSVEGSRENPVVL